MTRVCAKCKQFLGEKCPECGEPARFHRALASGRIEALCSNQKCVMQVYLIGDNGVTHGLCAACAAATLPPRSPEQVSFENLADACVAGGYTMADALRLFRAHLARKAVERANGNQSRAARLLGFHRNNVKHALDYLRVEDPGLRKPVQPIRAHETAKRAGGGQ